MATSSVTVTGAELQVLVEICLGMESWESSMGHGSVGYNPVMAARAHRPMMVEEIDW